MKTKRISIRLIDKNFVHVADTNNSVSAYYPAKYIDWYRGEEYRDIAFFTEQVVQKVDEIDAKIKIAWFLEPMSKWGNVYRWTVQNSNKFDYVFTFDKDLLSIDRNKYIFIHDATCWTRPNNYKIHEKTKNLSIIASGKRMSDGHLLRHRAIKEFGNKMDVYGRQSNRIEFKADALKSYRYNITIEFCNKDFYFTEKLIDCFATGTVPIYWGCPSIGHFFDRMGIITFSTIDELGKIIDNVLSEKDYQSRMPYIKTNFELSKNYLTVEDYMYTNILMKIPRLKELIDNGIHSDKEPKFGESE